MSAPGVGIDSDQTIDVLIVTAVEIEYAQALLVDTGAWPDSVWDRRQEPSGVEIALGRSGSSRACERS